MPRIHQLQDKYAAEDFLREIRAGQGAANLMNGRALSDACGIPYQTLMRRIRHPEDFTLGEIKKLVKAVHIHPLVLLSFVGYSKRDFKQFAEQYKEENV